MLLGALFLRSSTVTKTQARLWREMIRVLMRSARWHAACGLWLDLLAHSDTAMFGSLVYLRDRHQRQYALVARAMIESRPDWRHLRKEKAERCDAGRLFYEQVLLSVWWRCDPESGRFDETHPAVAADMVRQWREFFQIVFRDDDETQLPRIISEGKASSSSLAEHSREWL